MPVYALGEMTAEFPADDAWWVAPNATLVGSVVLKRHASVWFGAVLRADNDRIVIGERSNVQDNSVVHTDPGVPTLIGEGVTVGHNVIVHSASIGDNTLVGMGSILLTGCRIGRYCLIGANTLIGEGKVIPDNSVVLGSPGRIVKQVDERQLALLQMSAEIYVKNYQRFRAQLRELA